MEILYKLRTLTFKYPRFCPTLHVMCVYWKYRLYIGYSVRGEDLRFKVDGELWSLNDHLVY